MKFCPSCGKQMDDSSKFCVNCGTQIANIDDPAQTVSAAAPDVHGKHLHCPECGSRKISPIVESTNNGGMAINSSVTKRVGVSGVSFNTTHRNYWLCQDCGHKFRNIQNLSEELATETQKMKACLVFSIIFAVMGLVCVYLCSTIRGMSLLLSPATFMVFLCAILLLVPG